MRLIKDVRANTLVIMGMSIIPLAGMVGGGIDISRMYILKTRLQHACDAGALAGRKTMGGGTWSQTVGGVANYPRVKAFEFFDGNFQDGSYGSYNRVREYQEQAGKVTGTASAMIPMTLMKVFQRPDEKIEVKCTADMRLPNTDVMFVLDVTGSMGSAQPGDSVTKMQAAKTAVKCFYEIVARLDTDANCTTGTPSGGTGSGVQIRFGFVPYATNVNVGKLLNPEWFADSWNYQTRTPRWWIRRGVPTVSTTTATTSGNSGCNSSGPSTTAVLSAGNTVRTATTTSVSASFSGGSCTKTTTIQTAVYDWREGGFGGPDDIWIEWRYNSLPVNVALLKNGMAWNDSFQWPVDPNGAPKTINWDGCVEERATVKAASYDPVPSGAKDLDLDSVPQAGDPTTQWGPVLNDVIYTRRSTSGGAGSTGSWNLSERINTTEYRNNAAYSCATESKKLQQWPDANTFDSYVDQLQPAGNTYHDIGLIWGGRLISPTGIFRSENEFTAQGGEIERHLIFMTDGDACTENYNYTAYGVAWFDRRQTDAGTVPSGGCTNSGTLTQQVNVRTETLCKVIKNKNVTLWVIAFGNLATSTEARLSTCATPGRYFKATNAAGLQQTFKQIADQISSLRLTS